MVTQQIGNSRARSTFWRTHKCISRYEPSSAFTKGFFTQYMATILEDRVRRFVSARLSSTSWGNRLLPEIAVILGHMAVYPLKLIRTRLIQQAKHEKYAGAWDCFIKMRQEEGTLSLWSGMVLDTARVFIGLLFNNWIHESITLRAFKLLTPSLALFAAVPSELLIGLITFPLLTIVTKIQAQAADIPKRMRPDVRGIGSVEVTQKTLGSTPFFSLWNGYMGFCLRTVVHVATVTALTHTIWKISYLRNILLPQRTK